MDSRTEKEFLDLAREVYPREAVAFLVVVRGKLRLVPASNVSETPEDEVVTTPEDWNKAESIGEVVALVHSHPGKDSAPSTLDQSACAASGLDWIICGMPEGPDGPIDWTRLPRSSPAALIGRPFIHGVTDCWTLTRDWYALERKIQLPDFHRSDAWWKRGESKIDANYRAAGFGCIGRGAGAIGLVQHGDFLAFHIDSRVPNHCAVYIHDNQILHHVDGRLSSRDPLSGFYVERLTHVMRYGAPDNA